MGMPASTRASDAAEIAAHLVLPSAWRTSMNMSMLVRGKYSVNTVGERLPDDL
jgi:hypothetical protein